MRAVWLGTLGSAVLLLTACATPEQLARQQEQRDRFLASRPVCTSDRQCEAMWAAARNWVTSTCGMKIQTMTDSFLETYNSIDMRLACRVTKDPLPQGGYRFEVTTGCGNMFGCAPDSWQAAFDFNTRVTQAGAAFAGQ